MNIKNIVLEEIRNLDYKKSLYESKGEKYVWDSMKTPKWNDMLRKIKNDYDIDNIFNLHKRGEDESIFYVERDGYKPVPLMKVKNRHILDDRNIDWLIENILLLIPKTVNYIIDLKGNIRKLPSTASIQDKIRMWRLVGQKANIEYTSRSHSENWIYKINDKYAPYWYELYDAIKDTPEFEEYRKKHSIAKNINFDDMLA